MQKYYDIVLDSSGNAVLSATITVSDNGGGVSTIYSDDGVTVKANPFTASSTDGAYAFYAANGRYDINIAATGFTTENLTDILLSDATDSGYASTIINVPAGDMVAADAQSAIDEIEQSRYTPPTNTPRQAQHIYPTIKDNMDEAISKGGGNIDFHGDLTMGVPRNLQYATEDMSVAQYVIGATTVKTPTDTIDWNGITLSRVDFTGFNGSISKSTYPEGTGRPSTTPVIGQHYLFSCYMMALTPTESFIWPRKLASGGANGHNARLLTNRVRRIWVRAEAVSTTTYDLLDDPTVASGSGTGSVLTWAQAGNLNSTVSLYMGGFQREAVASAVEGIVVTGDSRTAGTSGYIDASNSAIWTRYAEGILQVPFYARGVGGKTLPNMDTDWATNVTPLAVNCSHVMINGGTNDIGNFSDDGTDTTMQTTLTLMKNAVISMTTKAGTDSLIPVYVAIAPNANTDAEALDEPYGKEALRQAYISWLKETYALVLDFDSVLADPHMPRSVLRDSDWYDDGTHPEVADSSPAARAIGMYVASWEHWNFAKPSAYQPWLDASYSSTYPDTLGILAEGGFTQASLSMAGLTGVINYFGNDDAAVAKLINFTGAASGNVVADILADTPKWWFIDNQVTGFTLQLRGRSKTNAVVGGATGNLATGQHIAYSDGTQIYLVV